MQFTDPCTLRDSKTNKKSHLLVVKSKQTHAAPDGANLRQTESGTEISIMTECQCKWANFAAIVLYSLGFFSKTSVGTGDQVTQWRHQQCHIELCKSGLMQWRVQELTITCGTVSRPLTHTHFTPNEKRQENW